MMDENDKYAERVDASIDTIMLQLTLRIVNSSQASLEHLHRNIMEEFRPDHVASWRSHIADIHSVLGNWEIGLQLIRPADKACLTATQVLDDLADVQVNLQTEVFRLVENAPSPRAAVENAEKVLSSTILSLEKIKERILRQLDELVHDQRRTS